MLGNTVGTDEDGAAVLAGGWATGNPPSCGTHAVADRLSVQVVTPQAGLYWACRRCVAAPSAGPALIMYAPGFRARELDGRPAPGGPQEGP